MSGRAALAGIAGAELRRRQGEARRLVDGGRLPIAKAEQLLRPWAAIACRLGADVAELAGIIAANRTEGWAAAGARSWAADQICPRATWAPVLATARDVAIAKAEGARDAPGHAELVERARGLMRLTDHFARDINGRNHIRPFAWPADAPFPPPLYTGPAAQPERIAA